MFGARTAKDSRLPASALRDWLPKGDATVPGLEKPFKHLVAFLSVHVRELRAMTPRLGSGSRMRRPRSRLFRRDSYKRHRGATPHAVAGEPLQPCHNARDAERGEPSACK